MNNLTLAARQLLRSPGYTIIVVLTLGLGIAVNTAIFTLAHSLLGRPMPGVPEQDRLVQMGRTFGGQGFGSMSYGDFLDLREQAQGFAGLFAIHNTSLGLGYAGESERVPGAVVSGNFFEVLRVPLAAGRGFLPEEDSVLGGHAVAVLSHGLWERRFAADPSVVGKAIELNGERFTVVGVAGAGFDGIDRMGKTEVWVPMAMLKTAAPTFEDPAAVMKSHALVWLGVIGRLKDGVSLQQAQAEVSALFPRLLAQWPDKSGNPAIALGAGIGIGPEGRAKVLREFLLLQCVVVLVLAVACANVTNLQLARGLKRVREVAIRSALGASRWHIIRALLTENLLLAVLAGFFGVFLSFWFLRTAQVFGPTSAPLTGLDLTPDWRVYSFAGATALAAALAAGLMPALRSGTQPLVETLKQSAAQGSAARSRLKETFVIAQVTLSLVLLVVAGLFVRTLQEALKTRPGYSVERVVIASMDLGMRGYDAARGRQFFDQLLDRVRAIPGIKAVALAPSAPFGGVNLGAPIRAADARGDSPLQLQARFAAVSPGFFATLELPLLAGRAFGASDGPGGPAVALIDETSAKKLWPNENPIGKQLSMGSMDGWRTLEVIGIVGDARYRSIMSEPERSVYLPFAQNYQPWMTIMARTESDPEKVIPWLRSIVSEMDRGVPLYDTGSLTAQLDRSLWQQRFTASLMSVFSALALALAILGLYGVMSFLVNQRTHEIGIRMALGAERGRVLGLVLRQGMRLALIGMGIGVLAGAALSWVLHSLLYEVTASDPLTLVGGSLLLGGVALIACWLPARRAAKIQPMVALRYE